MSGYRRLTHPVDTYRWGTSGPPPDAYSRYSELERFKSLQTFAHRILEQLDSVYEVSRTTAELPGEPDPARNALEAVRLAPMDPSSAAITVGLTPFPGLALRCGHWMTERFPACGCDACGETGESEAYRFENMIVAVAQGFFRENVVLPFVGRAWYRYELRTESSSEGSLSRLNRSTALEMIRAHGRSVTWKPWAPRPRRTSPGLK